MCNKIYFKRNRHEYIAFPLLKWIFKKLFFRRNNNNTVRQKLGIFLGLKEFLRVILLELDNETVYSWDG